MINQVKIMDFCVLYLEIEFVQCFKFEGGHNHRRIFAKKSKLATKLLLLRMEHNEFENDENAKC